MEYAIRYVLHKLILIQFTANLALATVYVVNAAGGGDYTTVQACANVAVAGDTCAIVAGTYDERVSVPRSGSSGNPITFIAQGATKPTIRAFTVSAKSYVTLSSLELTNSGMSSDSSAALIITASDHLVIYNNYIHDTTFVGIRANSNPGDNQSAYLHIYQNTLVNIGPYASRYVAVQLWTNHSLIENNDASHCGDFNRIDGNHNVLRNNTWHSTTFAEIAAGDHIDGWQGYCTGDTPAAESANYLVIENNYMYDVQFANVHFSLINGTDTCGGTTDIIVRGNTAYNIGSQFYSALAASQGPAYYHKAYNNTVVNFSDPADHLAIEFQGVTTSSTINNILYNAGVDSSPYYGYDLKSGDATSGGDYNLGYFTSGTKTWSSPINAEAHHVLNQDPLFVSSTSNFHLQAGSPALGAGGPLTSVAGSDSGTGTSLVVNDSHFFQDSYGITGVQADWIRIGASTTVQISSIDYATNTITLANSVSRSASDPVYLYKDSSGNIVLTGSAPNIGAFGQETFSKKSTGKVTKTGKTQ